jgi:hypothetical protein
VARHARAFKVVPPSPDRDPHTNYNEGAVILLPASALLVSYAFRSVEAEVISLNGLKVLCIATNR